MSKLCRLKPIFPAVAAQTKARKIGNLLLDALKTSVSQFDNLGSFCLSKLCRLKPIFPAVAAQTKARKIRNLLLSALKTSVSPCEKHQVCMRYLATLSLKNSPFLFELTVFPKSRPSSQIPGFRAGRLETHRGSNPPWSGTAPGAHKHARTACLTIFPLN